MEDLRMIKELWERRMYERKKQEEVDEIIRKKKEDQDKQMQQLHKAAEYIQAHWLGLIARRDAEKARKKGKKKGRKKK